MSLDSAALAIATQTRDAAARNQPLLQPIATGSEFPFQSSTGVITAGNQVGFRTMHYFPKGGKSIRLLYSSVFAGATETPTLTGFPLKLAASIEPAPWDAARTYQPGDVVTAWGTQFSQFSGGSDTYISGNPYFIAVNASTGSRPTPANSDWTKTGTAFPSRYPITVEGVQDASFATQTLPGGTATAKGLVLTDPLPFPVPAGGWLGIYAWLPCSGSQLFAVESQSMNLLLAPLSINGASVVDVTGASLNGAGFSTGSVLSTRMRPAAIIGRPLSPAPGVVIVGDSIAQAKNGGAAFGGPTIVSGGTGYKVGDQLTVALSGGTAGAVAAGVVAKVIVDRVDASGTITLLHLLDGSGLSNTATQTGQTLPTGTQTLSGGAGTGATATFSISGNSFDSGDTLGGQGYIQRALNVAGVPWSSFASAGDRANLWVGSAGTPRSMTRLAAIARTGARNAILALGRNDITAGDGLATIQANLVALANALIGCGVEKVFVATVTGEVTSTTAAGCSTLVDQTVSANNATRLSLNAWIRTVPAPFAGMIDVAATIEEGGATAPTGKFLPIGGLPAAADGKHPGPAAITLMQAAVAAVVPRLAT